MMLLDSGSSLSVAFALRIGVAALALLTARHLFKAMGGKGREWMMRDFSWDRVAHDMLDVYVWLSRGGEPPPMIRFD